MLVTLTRLDGGPTSVNPSLIRFARPQSGNDNATMLYFDKEHYMIVQGDLATITDALSR
ncbi:hypothetical protein [Sphingomonas sp. UBA978]|uniref:hypothetical protein n=1 Tax=Sphingomonas sp. UBA978 TaxID=1947536 RepID=UPI0025F83244|nr:hypothetical protein [Sphingomonas sp. UBA978]